jgi:hypothetical protein
MLPNESQLAQAELLLPVLNTVTSLSEARGTSVALKCSSLTRLSTLSSEPGYGRELANRPFAPKLESLTLSYDAVMSDPTSLGSFTVRRS